MGGSCHGLTQGQAHKHQGRLRDVEQGDAGQLHVLVGLVVRRGRCEGRGGRRQHVRRAAELAAAWRSPPPAPQQHPAARGTWNASMARPYPASSYDSLVKSLTVS